MLVDAQVHKRYCIDYHVYSKTEQTSKKETKMMTKIKEK